MAIGELLLEKNLISEDQIKKVLHQQKIAGGHIGDNLIALGYITREKLEAILQEPPPVPKAIEETGLGTNFLLNSVLRIMYISAIQTIPEISEQIKLTRGVIESLLDFAKKRRSSKFAVHPRKAKISCAMLSPAPARNGQAKHSGDVSISVRRRSR